MLELATAISCALPISGPVPHPAITRAPRLKNAITAFLSGFILASQLTLGGHVLRARSG